MDAGPEFFKGGQPGLPEVYYGIDAAPLIAYDWVYTGLSSGDRQIIEGGILASARFRMRAMDRWSQTANLVFTPTYMVATAGLVTGQKELVDWGFYRKPGSSRGGYFSVLDVMLRDGGPWGEAPIYPTISSLVLMTRMSRHLQLLTGQDWFGRVTPSGSGSPKGLVEYYVDTAYPIERTGRGAGQIRVATYGDGATSAEGDLFLVNPAGSGLDLQEAVAEAYAASGDPRYAAFLAMVPDYRPNLVDRRPLPPDPRFPPAPSRIWPSHGLAMLRSDESPAYWTSSRALAVSQIMSQGYGHDHRDKFSLTLHGAGRLLYPDYNAIQYENPAIGWTRNSVAHNTLVVDEKDTRDAAPTGIRYEFTPGVKFLATSASGVFEGVDQTRVLMLTGEYLLDFFHAMSAVPHVYDYLLHSFGRPRPGEPERYKSTSALLRRYWLMARPQGTTTDDQWPMDFVLDGATAREKEAADRRWLEETLKKKPRPALYGREWYEHTAAVRLTMGADHGTLVAYGVGRQDVPMLVARRAGRRDTLFVATHEPFAGVETPGISRITTLARSRDAVVVRVDARDYTDYAAAAFGPQTGQPEHVLVSTADARLRVAFKNYGYLRVAPDRTMTAWGGWTGFTLPGGGGALTLNGQRATSSRAGGYVSFGRISGRAAPPVVTEPENPFPVKLSPAVARVASRDRRVMTLAITNVLSDPAWGWLEFELPVGLTIDPKKPAFGPLEPGATANLTFTVVADNPAAGRHAL
ncbi:MAG TPA: heparinase II/III family protein, partial [Methylomirabilota bacterium]|nr:heparinase II/III family protein [Methylomirabilota bacterium]